MTQNLQDAIGLVRNDVDLAAEEIRNDPRISALRKLLQGLNALEDLNGQARTTLGSVLQLGADEGGGLVQNLGTRPDEFYGLEALEAAKRVLKKLGRSATLAEIVNGIRAGGGDVGSEDSLALSLARSTYEIAKIGNDRFGLVEFYPHIKRGKPGRKRKNGGKDEEPVSGEPEAETADVPTSAESTPKGDS